MHYYSTNQQAPLASLEEAVVRGLATDKGLYMPERIKQLPKEFFDGIAEMSFQEIAYRVADAFFGEDIPAEELKHIVYDTLAFDAPVVHVDGNIHSLELYHGPTLAFKDVGARFMARLLGYFNSQQTTVNRQRSTDKVAIEREQRLLAGSAEHSNFNEVNGQQTKLRLSESKDCLQALPSIATSTKLTDNGQQTDPAMTEVNVLVATSGDTGSAVANGFLGVEGIHVYVLYPKGKVSAIQECQFTTLGQNITALEVEGVFDDCQRLVKSAFMDAELNAHMRLTSANSINVARFLPQAFYYFYAYAQMKRQGKEGELVVCVPSGNFGNLCAGLFAHRMGLPIKRFIAANNRNDIFYQYLQTGEYNPRASVQTIANAMDVGDPSNFARILDLYGHSHADICGLIGGAAYTDEQIAETLADTYRRTGYLLDPHGACGYRALSEMLQPGEQGVFLETAHPAKFRDTVEGIVKAEVAVPEKLQAFMRGTKQSVPMTAQFEDFKAYLMSV